MKVKLQDKELVLPDGEKQAVRYITDMFGNRGQTDDAKVSWEEFYQAARPKVKSLKDSFSSPDLFPLLQTSMQEVIRMPVEPLMVVSSLFTQMQTKAHE